MKIFINYRREDAREKAFILAKSLMARFGEANVFFDRQGIQAGENFVRTIENAFNDCRIFIPLIGSEWNNILLKRSALAERDFVLEEISHAFNKGVKIIPVLIDDGIMPSKKDLPEKLHQFAEIQAFFLSTDSVRLPYDLENLNSVVMKNLIDWKNEVKDTQGSSMASKESEGIFEKDQVQLIINGTGEPEKTITDTDDNIYPIVSIGKQIWMAKNLNVTHYQNGDRIPDIKDNDEWKNTKAGACCSYNNDMSNRNEYGLLYNWYAITDPRSICPPGWHVPTKDELEELRKCSGDWKSTGGWLKEKGFKHWHQPNTGAVNKTGFTALPGGMRSKEGHFSDLGYKCRFWSSTQFGKFDSCFNLFLVNSEAGAMLFHGDEMNNGFSVRCIKDQLDL